MKTEKFFFALAFACFSVAFGSDPRYMMPLNGTWQFDQTKTAFPPSRFGRIIPVPGLIHLAQPPIDQYNKLYAKSKTPLNKTDHRVLDLQYEPRYNWYRRQVEIPASFRGLQAVLTIKKSQYVTQVFINGMDAGSSIECYTPIDLPVTSFLRFDKANEIMIRVGDRAWLLAQAAGSTDKEKVNYLPGIWDDVELSFTDFLRVHRALVLPSLKNRRAVVKLLIRNFNPAQQMYGDPMEDSCLVRISVCEKASGNKVIGPIEKKLQTVRDNLTFVELILPFDQPHPWSPEDPFLYRAQIELLTADRRVSDSVAETFGMRDFERRGKFFYLNGERRLLRGTNITLHRFFEDPDCRDLPWNRAWVTKLLAHYPKQLHWNAMRICVGIAPDFWYDIADSVGLMLQNEWLYWQDHGWDEQIRAEYTNWVWSDGSHPSIVIWDAINENWNDYIGNFLIPELKRLDPTRIWDAGYMTDEHMAFDEMDEPHPYMQGTWMFPDQVREQPYPLGDLHYWPAAWHRQWESSAAQLVNEYGWVWLWRNGSPSHLTRVVYDYYLGPNASPQACREMQAYWLQCETEALRVRRDLAGILAFCYLSDNLGFTGDWWMGDVSKLEPAPALAWFRHCFAPSAVFIDLTDHRYAKAAKPFKPKQELAFNLIGVTDYLSPVSGQVNLQLLNGDGESIWSKQLSVEIPPYANRYIPVVLTLPEKPGGYLLTAEFTPESGSTVISRRYLRVGETEARYYDLPIPELTR
ncbi:MAG: glycoside hydrolase family 2 [candidate division KSB1 bacterium]|nr:glycoside hydrolase family 2 [candidate division KSB1 bacterium]